MKALILKRYGKPDQVQFADIPRPVLKADEILMRVHAVGLNPIDTMIPKGIFKPFRTEIQSVSALLHNNTRRCQPASRSSAG